MEMTTTTAIIEANYIILRLATKVWTINKRGAAIQKKNTKLQRTTRATTTEVDYSFTLHKILQLQNIFNYNYRKYLTTEIQKITKFFRKKRQLYNYL